MNKRIVIITADFDLFIAAAEFLFNGSADDLFIDTKITGSVGDHCANSSLYRLWGIGFIFSAQHIEPLMQRFDLLFGKSPFFVPSLFP